MALSAEQLRSAFAKARARQMPVVISVVNSATNTKTRDITIEKVLETIRTGGARLKGQIQRIRNRFETELDITGDRDKAKKAVEALKKELPAVTFSGRFSERAGDKLIAHSGYFPADLDSLGNQLPEIRKKLQASPYVSAMFLSPTGDGLKVIVKVCADNLKHQGSFRAVQKHFRELCGVEIDESGKDVSRLCFMSYDPDLYENRHAIEIAPLPETPKAPTTTKTYSNGKPTKEQIREMLAVIPKRPDYHDWIKVVSAVGDALSDDEAIEVLTEWSEEEEPGEYAGKLRHRLEDVHIWSLIHLAKEHGWQRTPDDDDKKIVRLASLPVLEYERCRKDEAEKLGIKRVSVLDELVSAQRPNPASDKLQGSPVSFPEIEPWPEPVNGAQVLDEIATRFTHYVVLPTGASDACSLWCTHTHMYTGFQKSARLNISAPTEECGKSTLRNCVSLFCARAKRTENMTSAVMFRLVTGHSPTILADECDKWLFTNEELVGLVQSGYEKGGTVMRCEGDSNELREFGVYAPFVLAAIGTLPSQLHTRSICVRLERARKEEMEERSLVDFEDVEYEMVLNRKLARWVADNRERIQSCDPKLPAHLFSRIADNWRPLFKISEAAGADWPKRCADALVNLTTREDERENLRVMLLTDIKQVFTVECMFSKDLCDQLAELKERPWPEICRGKPITQNWLARNLAAFRIRPGNVRIDGNQAKGYELEQFKDAFERYVSPSKPIDPLFQPSQPSQC